MANKIFSATGGRLHSYTGDKPHEWVLKDESGKEYFRGTAEELDAHTAEKIADNTYSYSSRKGRKKKK
jgi:hypothetical protein